MKEQNVMSLFDGMANGAEAMDLAKIPIKSYNASEIDIPAMKVAKYRFPHINHIGDICNIDPKDWTFIDIIIGGSPCQSVSAAGSLKGMTTNDGQVVNSLGKYLLLKELGYGYNKKSLKYFNTSCLFWEYVRIYRGIKKYNPNVKFFLENVVNRFWGYLITNEMGVNPIRINSSVVIPQNRDRYYWTDIKYTPIPERRMTLNSIIPDAYSGAGSRGVPQKNWAKTPDNQTLHIQNATVRKDQLANCLTASGGKINRRYLPKSIHPDEFKRRFKLAVTRPERKQVIEDNLKCITISQAEQLQTVKIGYTDVPGVSQYQRFKMIGNGWTVAVITHFFKCFKLEIESKNMSFSYKS